VSGLLAFFGLGAVVQLLNDSVVANATHPSNATGSAVVDSSGNVTDTGGLIYKWLKNGVSSNYEILCTINNNSGGTPVGDAAGTWWNLGITRSFGFTRTTIGVCSANITLQIRPVGGSPIASCTISFDVEVN
jgi:hypothetical protein